MKTLLSLSLVKAFALIVLLAGCAGMSQPPLPVSQELSEPVQLAQSVINESWVTVIAAANVTTQYVEEGWLTKAEGRDYFHKLADLNDQLIEAQALLEGGNALAAKSKAELLQKAINVLHAEIVKRKPQEPGGIPQ